MERARSRRTNPAPARRRAGRPATAFEARLLGRPAAPTLALLLMLAAWPTASAAGEAATPRAWGRALPAVEAPAEPGDGPVASRTADSPAGDGAASESGAAPTEPAPSGTIALADALAAALQGSPALAAQSIEVRRREARALQAGMFPNPVVSLVAEDFAGESQKKSLGYQQTTLSLAQLVELGGKRAARRRLADRDRDLATWDYETRRVAVLADTTKAFLVVLALQERKALLGELESIATEMLRSVASTVRAGAVSPVEEDRAHVNLDRVGLEVAQLDDELEAARALLAASWGQARAGFDAAKGDLWALPPTPELEALEQAAGESPELARWNAEIAQREAALSVERAARIPNVEVSIAGRHHPLGDAAGVVAGLSIPVPLFDRNQGGILAARHELARARSEQRQRDVSVRSAIVASLQSLQIADRTVRTLRDQIIPRAQRVFEQTRRGYATGLFRHVEVLDAQRTLFAARRELLDAVVALQFAATDLERLTGTPLSELAGRTSR
ncbi:MAG: TolC family protein [Deltaproteobacteria bacterium]|nr:TolC family protein [Deltaproteobacteria bacterium]